MAGPLDARLVVADAALANWRPDGESLEMLHLAVQIGPNRFSRFFQPDEPISQQAHEATGLELRNGELYRHGKPVVPPAQPEHVVMQELLEFLAAHAQPGLVLVTHNIRALHVVVDAVMRQGLCVDFEHLVGTGHTSAAEMRQRLNLGAYGEGGDCTLKTLAGMFNVHYDEADEAYVTDQRLDVLCRVMAVLGITSENLWSPLGGTFRRLHAVRDRPPGCGCQLAAGNN